MSWLFAKVYDRLTEVSEEACGRAWRAELLSGLSGEVLEVGAGTGHNLAHYPPGVTRLVLTEPDRHMRGVLATKLGGTELAVEIVDAGAERLPFEDGAFDAVVATLVLCSVPDVPVALAEMRRVLKPGGRLLFLEHVAARGKPRRLRWQRRVEPVWKRLAGGCHLTRDTAEAIEAGGFEVVDLRRESMRKAMPIVRNTVRGTARNPA